MNKIAIFAWGLAGINAIVRIMDLLHFLVIGPSSGDISAQVSNLIVKFILIPFGFLAALIVSRQPRNAIGWLLFLPATVGILDPEPYIRSFNTAPQHPPFWLYLALFYYGIGWLQLIFPLFFIPMLFPTGKPLSPRWAWLVRFGIGMCAIFIFVMGSSPTFSTADLGMDWSIPNPIGFLPWDAHSDSFSSIFFPIWLAGLMVITVLSAASLLVRYHRANVEERAQIKWLLYACALFAVAYGASNIFNATENNSLVSNLVSLLVYLSIIGFPISIAIAILHYHLWDIDLIIRRTIGYAILTFMLGLVYFGGVALLQAVFTVLAGQQSPLAIVLSTLLIAALFNPLRRRIQTVIDRRFFRRRYDAERILARFNLRLKNQVDGEALHSQLKEVVTETLQPKSLGLWIRGK